MGYRCERCGHEWVPRGDLNIEPRVCPKCKSPYWDRERKMSYEEFRDKVKAVLAQAHRPMTWTQIRTEGALSQMYPNNQWVRRMEQDIKLDRQRDRDGVIHWQLADDENLSAPTVEVAQSRPSRSGTKKGALE
jgi:hypothetical protein